MACTVNDPCNSRVLPLVCSADVACACGPTCNMASGAQAAAAQGGGGVTGVKRAKTGNAPGDFGRFTYSGSSTGAPRRLQTSFSGGADALQVKLPCKNTSCIWQHRLLTVPLSVCKGTYVLWRYAAFTPTDCWSSPEGG